MPNEDLKYEDLKLGEKRKEMFLSGKSWDEINKKAAFYLNTKPVIHGLNVTDFGIAAVLGKLPLLLIGRPGCGKSQENYDFARYYFGGTGKEGSAKLIDGRKKELDIYDEIFTRLDREKLGRVMTDSSSRCYFALEESNRQPNFTQNQFLGLTTGEITSPEGELKRLGRDGYSTFVATANIGDGEYKGSFEDDKALRDRFGVVIDFDYEMFKPTDDDLRWIGHLAVANPEVKDAPIRDISKKILKAHKEISKRTLDKTLEEIAFMDFLKFGLKHCKGDGSKVRKGIKESKWQKMYKNCQDCGNNADGKYLCSLIREIDGRTLSALPKYINALEFLIKLKNPEQEIDATELMFKAFELTGAYQNFLNPFVLQQKYDNQAPKMMADVVEKLKQDYNGKKDQILAILDAAKRGINHRDIFYIKTPQGKEEVREGKSQLKEKIDVGGKKENKVTLLKALNEQGYEIDVDKYKIPEDNIGYSWVESAGDFIKEIDKVKNSTESNPDKGKN